MYTISYPSGVIRTDGVEVLPGPAMDAYVDWLRAGNGPIPLQDPPGSHRVAVSAWQIRKALNQLGLREQVESAVSASENRDLADGWQHATEFESDHPFVIAMAAILNMSNEEMQALFVLAEGL